MVSAIHEHSTTANQKYHLLLPTSRLYCMQEQSTPWVVLSILNTMKHAALTDSWVGQQQKVIWTHQLILTELCKPENGRSQTVKCNPEVQNDLPPQWKTSVTTKIIKSSRWYDSWYVSKNLKQVMQRQGNPDVEPCTHLADYLLEK
jgi:hypothetical protein